MKRKINVKNLNKHTSLLTLSKYHLEDQNLKTAEEWIYGSLKKKSNNSIINFKNQKAFNGYKINRIDLYKSFILLINTFNIIDQIDNVSKRFELGRISDNFYQKLFNIYKKEDYHIQLRKSLKHYKISNKSNNKNTHKNKKNINLSLPNINNYKQKGKINYII